MRGRLLAPSVVGAPARESARRVPASHRARHRDDRAALAGRADLPASLGPARVVRRRDLPREIAPSGRRACPARYIEAARVEAQAACDDPLAAVVNHARMRASWKIADRVRSRGSRAAEPARRVGVGLERLATHPVWGLPVLAGVLWLAYEFVGVFGATTLVGLLENGLFNGWINPLAISFFRCLRALGRGSRSRGRTVRHPDHGADVLPSPWCSHRRYVLYRVRRLGGLQATCRVSRSWSTVSSRRWGSTARPCFRWSWGSVATRWRR